MLDFGAAPCSISGRFMLGALVLLGTFRKGKASPEPAGNRTEKMDETWSNFSNHLRVMYGHVC